MKTGDEVILVYAIIPVSKWDETKFPQGSFAKAMQVGKIEDLIDTETCKGWGAIVGVGICRLANKLCPELSKILRIAPDVKQPIQS